MPEGGNMTVQEQTKLPVTDSANSRQNSRTLRYLLIVCAILGIVLAFTIAIGINSRVHANSALQRETLAMSVPSVAVIHPRPSTGAEEVVVPGNMQAFIDTPIWARASGYLKAWHADIGAHVRQGQLLAEIDAPEVNQQLQQAKADLATAEANLKLAQITAERYATLFKTDSVAKQDLDNAVQDAAAKTATVTSARANVSRLEQLVGYENVSAPFDGVITARNIDVGALVDADANTAGKELFHLASTSTLRVYVNIPETYSQAAKPGVRAYLTLTEFPGKVFQGTVVRTSDAIDSSSRTLLTEVDVPNRAGQLLPGSYTSVHLKLPSKVQAVTVPSNVLLFRSDGLQAALVRANKTQLVPITMGRDFGNEVEIVAGLSAKDSVIVNPSDSIVSGQRILVAEGQQAN